MDLHLTSKLHLLENEGILKKAAAFIAHSGDSWFDLIAILILWVFTPIHGIPWQR